MFVIVENVHGLFSSCLHNYVYIYLDSILLYRDPNISFAFLNGIFLLHQVPPYPPFSQTGI